MTIVMENILRKYQDTFYPVIPFNAAKQSLAPIDLTAENKELTEEIFNNTDRFSIYIDNVRKQAHAEYLIGGYNELRAMYGRSELFGTSLPASPLAEDKSPVTLNIPPGDNQISNTGIVPERSAFTIESPEPRRLHLGIDIWGAAGTPIFAPLGGMIHSFAFNDHFGDYGATLILLHQLDGFPFYTLYGHVCLKDIENISTGQYVTRGQKIAHFGLPHENGHWPPHLHFQLILDMGLYDGDYPGVCRYSEREYYLNNCPDPDVVLQMNRYLKK